MGWIRRMGLKSALFTMMFFALLLASVLSVAAFYGCMELRDTITSGGAFIYVYGEPLSVRYRMEETPSAAVERLAGVLEVLQIILPVIIFIIVILVTSGLFYRIKLKASLAQLASGAQRIMENDLDFVLTGYAEDELGEVCAAFEAMRKTLYSNNLKLWRQAEERKRLNAAFSHDLRNPVTVLKGAAKLLQKGVDSTKESADLIYQYACRIENYVEVMTNAHKLEEMACVRQTYERAQVQAQLQSSLMILAETSGKRLEISQCGEGEKVKIDRQIVWNTAENLVDNALRYAKESVFVEVFYKKEQMELSVKDDGEGFPDTILQKGVTPFLRGAGADERHFGMGLYICKLSCEKHGGTFMIENSEQGAAVRAVFQYGES